MRTVHKELQEIIDQIKVLQDEADAKHDDKPELDSPEPPKPVEKKDD